ncbi:hypothetical protein M413DRAFT_446396 [Hebeloma cylindrosporum]|uniref:Calcineurin-like phosphoesterase domain-containing protein n=1 Tax=Hebeloma cylindrosporum TaxID=76867 RepID=A0A0C2XRI1_HEBCY|nr:hypothetical protein M413DRAFT_446396 [Hebeloma cylindrosporum h7]
MAAFARRRLVLSFLRVFWVFIIIWFEYGIFTSSVRNCDWPDKTLHSASGHNVEPVHSVHAKPTHVLLVADPQIVDRHSYPSRGPLLSHLTRLIVDLNLRKNWKVAVNKQPDAVVFLGDMMDNGREAMSDQEYEEYFQRFKHIFRTVEDIPQYYIPGNHDVGLGRASQFSPDAYARYVTHFGKPNREISLANHSLVLFDAPGYADEDAKRHGQRKSFDKWVPIPNGSLEYLKNFADGQHIDPVVLFSHIPLYRSDGKPCGPLRERGTIRPGVGPGYQNILEKQSSQRLLAAFKPVVIFSGDDHDYCEYTHKITFPYGPPQSVTEITVKTISMVMNVRRPGFQLLSLIPAELRKDDDPTFDHTPCLLPDQLRIYLNIYLPLLAISILAVFVVNFKTGASRKLHNKTCSDAGQVLFVTNADDTDSEDAEMAPYYREVSSLPSPVSSVHQTKGTSRSQNKGWFVLQGQLKAYRPPIYEDLGRIKDLMYSFLPSRSRNPHRRSWLGTVLRDIRDVAVFPLGTFVLVTWWVVAS